MHFRNFLISCAALLCVTPSNAAEPSPFFTRNLNPFIQIFGLPNAQSASIAKKGEIGWRSQLNYLNNSNSETDSNDGVLIDGETSRLEFNLRLGVVDGVELGIDIPWIFHEPGMLDRLIDNWHDITGLPNGERDKQGINDLDYILIRNGQTLYSINSSKNGIGDVVLSAGWQPAHWKNQSDSDFTLRVAVKLPTGDEDDLLGSGATDISVTAHYDKKPAGSNWSFFLQGGASWLDDGEHVGDFQESFVTSFSVGAHYALRSSIELGAQIDGHTAVYDTGLDDLGRGSLQLVVGGSWIVNKRSRFRFAVGEDLLVDTAPDVVVHIGYQSGL